MNANGPSKHQSRFFFHNLACLKLDFEISEGEMVCFSILEVSCHCVIPGLYFIERYSEVIGKRHKRRVPVIVEKRSQPAPEELIRGAFKYRLDASYQSEEVDNFVHRSR